MDEGEWEEVEDEHVHEDTRENHDDDHDGAGGGGNHRVEESFEGEEVSCNGDGSDGEPERVQDE